MKTAAQYPVSALRSPEQLDSCAALARGANTLGRRVDANRFGGAQAHKEVV